MSSTINNLPIDVIHDILDKCQTLNDLSRMIKVSRHIYHAYRQRFRVIIQAVAVRHFDHSRTAIAEEVSSVIVSGRSAQVGCQLAPETLRAYTNETHGWYEAWHEEWIHAQLRTWQRLEFLGSSKFLYTWSRNFIRDCIDRQKLDVALRIAEPMWHRIQEDGEHVGKTKHSSSAIDMAPRKRVFALMLAEIYLHIGRRDDTLELLKMVVPTDWTRHEATNTARSLIEVASDLDKERADLPHNPQDGILIPILRERASAEAEYAVKVSTRPPAFCLFWHGHLVKHLRKPPHISNHLKKEGRKSVEGLPILDKYLHEAIAVQKRSIAIHRQCLEKWSSDIDGYYVGKARVLCDLLKSSGQVEESLQVQRRVYDELLCTKYGIREFPKKDPLDLTMLYSHASRLVGDYCLAGKTREAVLMQEDLWQRTIRSLGPQIAMQAHATAGSGCEEIGGRDYEQHSAASCTTRIRMLNGDNGEMLYHAKNVAYSLNKLYEDLGMEKEVAELRVVAASIWPRLRQREVYKDGRAAAETDTNQTGSLEDRNMETVDWSASLPWTAREMGLLYVNGQS